MILPVNTAGRAKTLARTVPVAGGRVPVVVR